MNKVIYIISLFLLATNVTAKDLPDDVLLGVGKIISYEDKAERYQEIGRSPYSSEHHMRLIEAEFARIQEKYSIDTQVDFLWVIMSRSSFGSHYSERFSELLHKCCKVDFELALQRYLQSGTKASHSTQHKVKFIKAALSQIQEHHNKSLKQDK